MSAFEIVWGDLRADINKADAFRRSASRFEEIMQDFRGLPRNMIQGPKWTGGKRQPYYMAVVKGAWPQPLKAWWAKTNRWAFHGCFECLRKCQSRASEP